MVPMPTDLSLWPPDFSRCIMQASTFAGSKFLPVSSSSESGAALSTRGMKRSRICAPQA
jgi:hypothetical protein